MPAGPVPSGRRSRPVTPPGAPPHDTPQPYALLMRARDWAWWRPVLGLLLLCVLYLVAGVVIAGVALVTGLTVDLYMDLTDAGVLLLTNISLIVAIPIIWLCWAVAHGMRIGWSSSVLGRLRWRLFAPLGWRGLASLGVAVAVLVVIDTVTGPGGVTGPSASYGWLVLVVVLTTPLQAAAEEYGFRGYLSQAIAGWIGRPRAGALVAAVVTATLFSVAHLPPDAESFLYRFAMGLSFSALVWWTGGLEAAIVAHAVNNMVIFLLGGALGGAVQADASGDLLGWWAALLGTAGMVAYVLWVRALSRRLRPELLSPALDLRGAAQGPSGPSWPPAGPPPYVVPPALPAPAHGPSGYGPPAYGPPGYGPPAYGPPGYAPPGYAPPGYGPPAYGPPGYAPPAYGPAYGPPPGYGPTAAPAGSPPPPDDRWARPPGG
ncbi:CPBP family glutamic-type intramembrane protease [Modestobacter sp. SYSU DS0875]